MKINLHNCYFMLEIMNGTMLNILKVERRNEEKKMPLRLV